MSTVAQDPPEVFHSCQRRLGQSGRLGISALLFDPNGERRAHIGFNEEDRFPMASVVKVPIGMLTASEIANGALSLDEKITIHSRTATHRSPREESHARRFGPAGSTILSPLDGQIR